MRTRSNTRKGVARYAPTIRSLARLWLATLLIFNACSSDSGGGNDPVIDPAVSSSSVDNGGGDGSSSSQTTTGDVSSSSVTTTGDISSSSEDNGNSSSSQTVIGDISSSSVDNGNSSSSQATTSSSSSSEIPSSSSEGRTVESMLKDPSNWVAIVDNDGSTIDNAKDEDGYYVALIQEDNELVAKIDNFIIGKDRNIYWSGIILKMYDGKYDEGYDDNDGWYNKYYNGPVFYNFDERYDYKYNELYSYIQDCKDGITYSYKGSAIHRFHVSTTNVEDYNYHGVIFSSSTSWKTVNIMFSELEQGNWGDKRGVSFIRENIFQLYWHINSSDDNNYGNYGSLSVNDIKCYNKE
jgi:hypothetical protein